MKDWLVNRMLVSIMSKIISKIKHEEYKIDENITDTVMLGIAFEKSMMIIRGFWNKIFIKKSKGLLFLGKNVKLKCRGKMVFNGTALIEDGVKIDALSKGGIDIGEGFSIGRNSIIECTGVIRELGEKLIIGKNVGIAANAFISMRGPVTIGDDTIFGPNVAIHAENHVFDDVNIPIRLQGATRKGVTIGKDCWIGSNVKILDGVNIGDGCIIAAGAIVNRDIPDYSIAVGVPAKVIKSRKEVN